MSYLFTSESVSEGHPDKVSDQISDAIVDAYIAGDPNSHVACETLVTTNKVIISGEVKSKHSVNIEKIVRDVIRRIGYTKDEYGFNADTCNIEILLHEQSPDISRGVDGIDTEKNENQGAGDQGIMFGYACNETPNFMPITLDLSHRLLQFLAKIRRESKEIRYLRPDTKSQFTIEYSDDNKPIRITDIVLSTQHDEFILPKDNSNEAQLQADKEMLNKIHEDILNIVMPRFIETLPIEEKSLFNNQISYHINPTGKFVIGGPNGDTGLTGRKIIVDTYGGKGAHGGGAFSGKDPSKVDRSAAYAARYIAKNMIAAGVADEILIQISYAIGIAKPISIYVNTYGTNKTKYSDGEISKKIGEIFDLRPKIIEEKFNLCSPIYEEAASYGHFGRECKVVEKFGNNIKIFPWENLDCIDILKGTFLN